MNPMKSKISSLAFVSLLALVVVGLSSWKAPQAKKSAADTTQKSKKQEARYSKKTIITFDENGNPHEEVVEHFEGDENLRELFDKNMDFNFDFPPIPDLDFHIPDVPHVFMPPMYFNLDSADYHNFHFDGGNIELYNESLGARLHEQFELLGPEMQARMEELNERLRDMELQFDHQFNQNLDEQMFKLDESLNDLDFHLNDQLKGLDFQLDKLNDEWGDLSEFSNRYTEQLKEFEEAAQKELVKDGYLKEGEKIESISWSDDEIEFNGVIIKEEHQEKYRELKEKYLSRQWNRGRIE